MKKLDSSKRYLVAVSGGPDSMALLDMTRKQDVYLEVAHMNYHHRQSASRDEKIVRDYCHKYKIPFHKDDFDEDLYKGNFQASARKARYSFFKKICDRYKLDIVLVGHNLDDFIETYYMQKEKNIGVSYYGIKENNTIYGVKVFRPLLNKEKKTLIDYCENNDIIYGIDESNLSDLYTRNRIRHHNVTKMSLKQKHDLYTKIMDTNKDISQRLKKVSDIIKPGSFSVSSFFDIEDLELFLHSHFSKKSAKTVKEMLRQLKNSKQCVFFGDDLMIVKEYDLINVSNLVEDYEYVFNKFDEIQSKDYRYFKIRKKGSSFNALTLKESDFPISIRNYRSGDKIRMTYGYRQINRYFIDKKIFLKDRISYPIIVNRSDEVILVPGLGCDVNHYSQKPNIFVIKL